MLSAWQFGAGALGIFKDVPIRYTLVQHLPGRFIPACPVLGLGGCAVGHRGSSAVHREKGMQRSSLAVTACRTGVGHTDGAGKLAQVHIGKKIVYIANQFLAVKLSFVDGRNANTHVTVIVGLLAQHLQQNRRCLLITCIACNITHLLPAPFSFCQRFAERSGRQYTPPASHRRTPAAHGCKYRKYHSSGSLAASRWHSRHS